MAKPDKKKSPAAKGSNPNRRNGKAWKKSKDKPKPTPTEERFVKDVAIVRRRQERRLENQQRRKELIERFETLLRAEDESEVTIKARLGYVSRAPIETIEREIGKLVIAADKREKEAQKYRATQAMAAVFSNA